MIRNYNMVKPSTSKRVNLSLKNETYNQLLATAKRKGLPIATYINSLIAKEQNINSIQKKEELDLLLSQLDDIIRNSKK